MDRSLKTYLAALLPALVCCALVGCQDRGTSANGQDQVADEATLTPSAPPHLLPLRTFPAPDPAAEPRRYDPVVIPASLPVGNVQEDNDWWQGMLAPETSEDVAGPELNAPQLDSRPSHSARPTESIPSWVMQPPSTSPAADQTGDDFILGISPPLERMPRIEASSRDVVRLDRGHAVPYTRTAPQQSPWPVRPAEPESSGPEVARFSTGSLPPVSGSSVSLPAERPAEPPAPAAESLALPSLVSQPVFPRRRAESTPPARVAAPPAHQPSHLLPTEVPVTTVSQSTATGPRRLPAAPPVSVDTVDEPEEMPELAHAGSEPTTTDPMLAVNQRALALIARGTSLATRGAHYSARADFVKALRLITQANDMLHDTNAHSEALATALHAMREADDFVPQETGVEADLNLPHIIASHQTPILQDPQRQERLTALAAVQSYYTYAQEQFAQAAAGNPVASRALYSLARLYTVLSEQKPAEGATLGPKALALHQAALMTDPNNYQAANELGVLLAHYGQYAEARGVLLHGLAVSPQPELWHNLAVVYENLGENQQAQRARQEYQRAAAHPTLESTAASRAGSVVRWVDPEVFRAQPAESTMTPSPAPAGDRTAAPPADSHGPRAARKTGGLADWLPW